MALPDLTGINIENSYQRVVHTDGVNYYNGTGSLLNLGSSIDTGSFATTGSNLFRGSQTIIGSTSSSLSSSLLIQTPNTSASLAVTGDNKLKIYATTTTASVNIWTDNTYSYIGNVSSTGVAIEHMRMYIANNATQFNQACSFANGVDIKGSPWYGYVLNLDKGVYVNDDYLRFGTGRIDSSGSLGLGVTAPSASLHISGASSAPLFRIDSPASSGIIFVSGSGNVGIGTSTPAYLLEVNGTARFAGNILTRFITVETGYQISAPVIKGRVAPFEYGNTYTFGTSTDNVSSTATSGIRSSYIDHITWQQSSGNAEFTSFRATPVINQTGTANGITRGLYIAPTLTSAADFRAIETTNGKVVLTDTYSASGSASSGSLLDLSQTWNTTGTPTAIKLNVTDTTSNANSLLMDLQIGGASYFKVSKNTITTVSTLNAGVVSSNTFSTLNLSYQGTTDLLSFTRTFNPTSGTATSNIISIATTINQTGGANGITRGLYINPTLTSAFDFRAIETTRGNVLFQSGSTPLLFVSQSGNVGIGTSTPAYPLDVLGNIQANGTRRIFADSANGLVSIKGSAGGWSNSFSFLGSANTSRGGFGAFGSADVLNYYYIGGTYLAPTMVLTSGSNLVGINTTTPLATLDVSGSVRITNNAVITGSLIVTETDGNPRLDTSNGVLYRLGTASVDWRNRVLVNGAGSTTLDWENNQVVDTSTNPSIDWENRVLWDLTGGAESIDYGRRKLYNSAGDVTLDYNAGTFAGTAATASFVNALNQNVQITGSLLIKDILQLAVRTTTPTPVEGMIIASGSVGASKVYYYNGSTWNALF